MIPFDEAGLRTIHINKNDYVKGMEDSMLKSVYWYTCPNCKNYNIAKEFNYCPMCGYQINWLSYGNE